jgi:putative acetyltransferase
MLTASSVPGRDASDTIRPIAASRHAHAFACTGRWPLIRVARAAYNASMDRPSFLVRPIRASDNPAVREIIHQVMTEFGAVGEGYSIMAPEVNAMAEAYAQPRSAYYVVELEGRVLGCAGIAPLANSSDQGIAELKKMYFMPALRGLGAGRAILTQCIEAARAHGFHTLYLETLAHMAEARRVYEAAGFARQQHPSGGTGHNKCDVWYSMKL